MNARTASICGAALLLLTQAAPAHAHLASTGFGDFYDGIAHVVITAEDLLVVAAVALLAGQRGTAAARLAVIALPLAWLVGGVAGSRWQLPQGLPLLTTLTFAVTGGLVAMNARLSGVSVAVLALAAGMLHGLANGPTMTPAGIGIQGLLGTVSAVAVLSLVIASHVSILARGWQQVAVRVGGSWVAASGVLMLGWLVRSTL